MSRIRRNDVKDEELRMRREDDVKGRIREDDVKDDKRGRERGCVPLPLLPLASRTPRDPFPPSHRFEIRVIAFRGGVM